MSHSWAIYACIHRDRFQAGPFDLRNRSAEVITKPRRRSASAYRKVRSRGPTKKSWRPSTRNLIQKNWMTKVRRESETQKITSNRTAFRMFSSSLVHIINSCGFRSRILGGKTHVGGGRAMDIHLPVILFWLRWDQRGGRSVEEMARERSLNVYGLGQQVQRSFSCKGFVEVGGSFGGSFWCSWSSAWNRCTDLCWQVLK